MRFTTIGLVVFGFPVLAFAQAVPCAPDHIAFDPYKPSDMAVIRQLGGSVLAQAPPATLFRLDPYVPTEAQLLREYGGGIPVWPFVWYPAYPLPASSPDCVPVPEPGPQLADAASSAEPPITTFAAMLSALDHAGAAPATAAPAASRSAVSASRRTGLWIDYGGRTWVSAGRAVAFDAAQFARVGELAGTPIFKPRGVNGDTIYVPTTPGVVAPFRAAK